LQASEQDVLVGQILPPQEITQRTFKTIEALTDYIRIFNITRGGFAYGDYPEVGLCYLLEYPTRVQD
jgi:phosphoribosylformylglycinamidine (FGAM) synthase-like amidotransferase family enzyme